MLTAGLGAVLLTGCGGEQKKTYEQANTDLEQGNYDYALSEYQSCISAGYKLMDSYRGSGIVKLRTGDYQGAIDDLTSALNDEKAGKSDLFFTIRLCNFTLTEITVIRKVHPDWTG